MADQGSVGMRNDSYLGPMPFVAFAVPPAAAGGGIRNDSYRGPMPFIGGRAFTGVAPDLITPIVANFGQAGGAVSIF